MKHLEDFTKQLKLSVDSRIQIAEYNMNKIITPFIPSNELCQKSDSFSEHSSQKIPTFRSNKLYNDQLFNLIEEYSYKICKLIYIRSRITIKNAVEVNKIIESEEYLQWDKKQMKKFFGEPIERPFNSSQP